MTQSIATTDSIASTYNELAGSSTSQSTATETDFKDLLMTMVLASTVSSMSGQSSSSMGDLMTPVLMMLMEKLLEQEVSQSQESSATGASSTISGAVGPGDISGMPVAGATLTQEYHSGHNGLDFGVPVGTPVETTLGGKVVYAGWNDEGYGNLVIVENGSYRTYYAHLSQIPVSVGDTVEKGDVIGLSGNTGNSTGPHLHYEVRVDGATIDPSSFTLPYL
ncbi:MAG: M23 family metallopeptidase [Chloroflexi bacterium]|jgi:murein DD-endopeptidase MepM/ murein hydrolase activator NlpD|nr:M23 family metallopeptidase [Anaerolineaceae bacterium]NMB90539.1 M23 family metallopeptidase [Chloroflexota bacterium]